MVGKLKGETRFHGVGVSPGRTVGRVCLFRQALHQSVPDYRVAEDARGREHQRLQEALEAVARQLETLKEVVRERVGPAEAEIFSVQRLLLQDPALRGQLAEGIDQGRNAEIVVQEVFETYERRLSELEDAYRSERASDLGELKRRILGRLVQTTSEFACESEPYCQRGRGRVVVTEELAPSLALEFEEDVRGLVTERGGPTSHAAILARSLGIPAVAGIPHIHELVTCGTEVLVDGDRGEVVVWPSAETLAAAGPVLEAPAAAETETVGPVPGLVVQANISLAEEVEIARRHGAEGVGLYRTEMEFFAADRLLDEDEQAERYARVVEAMDGRPVAFRLLDLGGDKPSPLFEFPPEDNPALGLRGLRYLLHRPDLLRTQARALARASARGRVRIMYPMVIGLAQYRRARAVVEEAIREAARRDPAVRPDRIEHGPMFEVPSAVLEAPDLLAEADFASVGSNDLLQYLYAVDRNNAYVAEDYTSEAPAFWSMLADLVRASEKAGVSLAVCGELAADPDGLARLLALGLRTVSVSARLIPRVRRDALRALQQKEPR